MAYSAVPTVNTNDPWSASDHNTYVKDNFAYFKALTDKLVGVGITPQFRLSLTTGDPIGTNTSGGTLYYVPYNGNAIQLYDGASWQVFASAELSLELSVTADKNYDVFVDYNAGTPVMRLSSAWTNDTTRADALAYQNGRLVKSGTPEYLFVGTIRASASNTVADSGVLRFVWNMYNRVSKRMFVNNANSHTLNGGVRLWNNSVTNNQLDWVTGLGDSGVVNASLFSLIKAGADTYVARVYGGLNGSFGSEYGTIYSGTEQSVSATASCTAQPRLGYNYFNCYEFGNHASSTFNTLYMDMGIEA